jgi:hypothetical protein
MIEIYSGREYLALDTATASSLLPDAKRLSG